MIKDLKKIDDYKVIKLLIVDNCETVRQSIKSIMEFEDNIEVIGEAVNGLRAVELSSKLYPDVILMDLKMPEMDGLEATRIINKNNPEIKIIALTGLGGDNKKQEMLEAGASFFISKYKLSIEELIKEINIPKISS
ncbi:MAG: response regulator transcription factor [Candidatus Humimicrobiaceae bacterium]